MKVIVIFLIVTFAGTYLISDSDAFFEGGIVEVPGQIMELSGNIISPGQTMFVNGTFNQPTDGFTANVFKNHENSRELVLTLFGFSYVYHIKNNKIIQFRQFTDTEKIRESLN